LTNTPALRYFVPSGISGRFGAAIPVNLEDALERGKLPAGGLLLLGGFAHAGDYAAAAVVRWKAGP